MKKPQAWPAAAVDMWPLGKIKPYPQNPRTHPLEQIERLAADMIVDGVTMPILVDEAGVIIAGHGRLLAALHNRFVKYPVVIARGWSEAQKRAARLKDNQIAALSGWDKALIAAEVGSLKLAGYDVQLLHFPEAQLRGWGITAGVETGNDPEKAPEPPARPIVRLGDLWELGAHRLLCGDATNKDDVLRLLGQSSLNPALMVTDPPYGVSYDPGWRTTKRNGTGELLSTGKGRSTGKVQNDKVASWLAAWRLFDGDVAYVWHGERQVCVIAAELEQAGLLTRNLIVWAKPALIVSRGHYHSQHETCWYAVRDGSTASWAGDRKQTTLWTIATAAGAHGAKDDGKTLHSTQKPIECMRRPIENHTRKSQAVYDPFSGSGTTIIAGEMTGRHVLALEFDPAYVQVAIERWQAFTGGGVARLGGKTLEQVAAARRKGRPK